MSKARCVSSRQTPRPSGGLLQFSFRAAGLDEVVDERLPERRATLLHDGPGTGKARLGLEFVHRAARGGRRGVLLPCEERMEAVRRDTFRWAGIRRSGRRPADLSSWKCGWSATRLSPAISISHRCRPSVRAARVRLRPGRPSPSITAYTLERCPARRAGG
jgi:hypothetical protein